MKLIQPGITMSSIIKVSFIIPVYLLSGLSMTMTRRNIRIQNIKHNIVNQNPVYTYIVYLFVEQVNPTGRLDQVYV